MTRTRSGKSVKSDGAQEESLKKLSGSYIKQRESLNKKGKLSTKTSPRKSNLTQTGKMLNDITTEIASTQAGVSLLIYFTHPESEDKALYVSDDRPFMNLSDKQLQRIEEELEKAALEQIDNELSKL